MSSGTHTLSSALQDVITERQRQLSVEGWTPEHDDGHVGFEMSKAATCYAQHAFEGYVRSRLFNGGYSDAPPPWWWPWGRKWWKPKSVRRDLVRAAALIVAEIERLDRADEQQARMLALHDGRQ
jgi:hypothetical protein